MKRHGESFSAEAAGFIPQNGTNVCPAEDGDATR